MNQFALQHAYSKELEWFPHVKEFALRKNSTIHFDSFPKEVSEVLRIYFIIDGKFEWAINHHCHVLYPGDIALVLPGQTVGGSKGYLDIGTLFFLSIEVGKMEELAAIGLGKWSTLSERERHTIGKFLLLN